MSVEKGVKRVGLIGYLNCLPLRLGLEATGGLDGVDLVEGTPAECNAGLLSGEVEVGLLSSASWATHRDRLRRLPDFGIVSEGEVMSVLLVEGKAGGIRTARRVGLSGESATSKLLAMLYLERGLGLRPTYEPLDSHPEHARISHDAALFIGDSALRLRASAGLGCVDLGEWWTRHTGLPMVYAVWACRPGGGDLGWWTDRLERAVHWAQENLGAVVDRAVSLGVYGSREELERYFGRCIRYRIGERESKGLERYLAETGSLTLSPHMLAAPSGEETLANDRGGVFLSERRVERAWTMRVTREGRARTG